LFAVPQGCLVLRLHCVYLLLRRLRLHPKVEAEPNSANAADSANEVGEIIVTANKREERLNKVGLTVSVLSGQDLNLRKITSLQDIAAVVPGSCLFTQR